jgi:hypothetical protein
MRIIEQPGDSRSIYEDETVFELAPDSCANCIRASLFSILPEPFARQLTTTCGTQAFLPVRPMECTPLSEKAKRAYELRAAAGCKPGRPHRPQACIPPDSYRWSRIM